MLDPALAWQALRSAEKLHSASVVQDALLRVSSDITRVLSTDNPLVLCVMGGAVVFSGQLLPLLNFPLSFDYLHVTRYGDAIEGGSIEWKVFPQTAIARRVVLVVDDILDAGQTMAEIRTRVMACGAERFFCAVLDRKSVV